MIILECGTREYYLWNTVSDDIWRINEPRDIRGILKAITTEGLSDSDEGLQTTLLELPGTQEATERQHALWREEGKFGYGKDT